MQPARIIHHVYLERTCPRCGRHVTPAVSRPEALGLLGGRNKAVVDAVLGPAFAGVLSSDFSAAYDHYPGPHQRCWRHLLADSHALLEQHPHDAALRVWADQVHGVYARARRCVATAEPDPAAREREQRACEAALLALCGPFLDADKAVVPQAVLCRRIQKVPAGTVHLRGGADGGQHQQRG